MTDFKKAAADYAKAINALDEARQAVIEAETPDAKHAHVLRTAVGLHSISTARDALKRLGIAVNDTP